MNYRILNNDGFKDIRVFVTWSGSNLAVQISYEAPNGNNAGVDVLPQPGGGVILTQVKNQHSCWLQLQLLPSTPAERRLMADYAVFEWGRADYCDAKLLLTPPITAGQWELGQHAVRLPKTPRKTKGKSTGTVTHPR